MHTRTAQPPVILAAGLLAASGCWANTPASPTSCSVPSCVGVAAQAADPDLNVSYVLPPPSEVRDGTATMEQIKAWMVRESLHMFPSVPAGNITLEIEMQDLDLDGIADVLVSNPHQSGSGGKVRSAFLSTLRGYRYIATFQGRIRTLPAASGGRIRAVIATASGAGTASVQLAELREDGLHRLVRRTLLAGDSGTEDGNRLYNELMNAKVVSSETLTKVFGRDR